MLLTMEEIKEKGKVIAKIAENKDEALWYKVVETRKRAIEQYEEAIKVEKVFLVAAERELLKCKRKPK